MAELKLLSKYEISMVESMHDSAGHIDNILEELPHAHILNDDEKSKIKNILHGVAPRMLMALRMQVFTKKSK